MAWSKGQKARTPLHQTKKLSDEDIKYIRDRFSIPIPDSEVAQVAPLRFYRKTPGNARYPHRASPQALWLLCPCCAKAEAGISHQCQRWKPVGHCACVGWPGRGREINTAVYCAL